MTTQYRWTNALAMGLAAGAVAYQTAVITEMLSGVSTVTKLGVPLATVTAAMLPVLAEAAWRGGERVKALLLVLPVAVLMAFVLPSGVSRLGEAQQARIDTAGAIDAEHAKVKADLAKADKLVSEADKWAAAECASGRGTKCKGLEFVLAQRRAYQRELQAKVESFKPAPQPWLPAWHPATLPIGLEIAIVVLLFYGFGPLTAVKHKTVSRETSGGSDEGERKPEAPKLKVVKVTPLQAVTERDFASDPISDEELEEIKRILGMDGCNNRQLASALGCSEGQASKLVSAAVAAGRLARTKQGREVRITPLH